MKLFLDIDGVLNSQLFYDKELPQEFENKSLLNDKLAYYVNRHICFDTAHKLYDFCIDNKIEIVISSSWRIGKSVEELKNIFEAIKTGMGDLIIDKTENSTHAFRGLEILNWCKANDCKDYMILDDDSDFILWQKNRFFKVDRYCGLTPTIFYKMQRLIDGEDIIQFD